MNILSWLRHWFCWDATWRYPDLAAMDENPKHTYPVTCTRCGYVRMETAGQIQDALADEAMAIAAAECFRRGTPICGRVEGGKVIVDEDDGTETVLNQP
jgi:hypothetical protein